MRCMLLILALCLACPAATVAASPAALDAVFEDYVEALYELDPMLASDAGEHRYDDRFPNYASPEWRAAMARLNRDALTQAEALDPAGLDSQYRLYLEVFIDQRRTALTLLAHPEHLLPIDHFFSTASWFAQLGAGAGSHPFRTADDYRNFMGRMDGYVIWTHQAIANMRAGMRLGIVQPRIVMDRVLAQLDSLAVARAEDSLFWQPIAALPADMPAGERARIETAWRARVDGSLLPAYRALRDFVRDEYRPACRDSVGLSALPGGADWYATLVRYHTTTDLSPRAIHDLGLAEVARIQTEMLGLARRMGFRGDLKAFFAFMRDAPQWTPGSREALMAAFEDAKRTVAPRLPELFELLPRGDFEIRPYEAFREQSQAAGSYEAGTEDGSRPGVFWANTWNLKARPIWTVEALLLHEGNPGHHLQLMVQRERAGLPRFMRLYGGYNAFSEGWGLYAESLGTELGLYREPHMLYGRLEGELWRAIRLVVDTGLHHAGWSRERVIAYMMDNSPVAEARAIAEAERYIAIPGQALAYKVGQLRIQGLRTEAERALGRRFDLRRFHTVVLGDGPLPMAMLERKVRTWIASQP